MFYHKVRWDLHRSLVHCFVRISPYWKSPRKIFFTHEINHIAKIFQVRVSVDVCSLARAYIIYTECCINTIIDLDFPPNRSSESHRAKQWQGLLCLGLVIFCSGSIKLSGLLVCLDISVPQSCPSSFPFAHVPSSLPLLSLWNMCLLSPLVPMWKGGEQPETRPKTINQMLWAIFLVIKVSDHESTYVHIWMHKKIKQIKK